MGEVNSVRAWRHWAVVVASCVGLAMLGVALLVLLPVRADIGLEVTTDREGVADGLPTTVDCRVFGGPDQHVDEQFGSAKSEACNRAGARRLLAAGAVGLVVGVGGVLVALRGRRLDIMGPLRLLAGIGAGSLAVMAVPALAFAWLGVTWSPQPERLPVHLARPFATGGLDIVLAASVMDTPSMSTESAPPNVTRYIVVTSPTATDEATVVEHAADALRRNGFELKPRNESRPTPWYAYGATGVEVGTVRGFTGHWSGRRAWDHEDIAVLLERAAASTDRPVALVITYTG